ncbi:MAG: phosphatase PAP2 family protein [Pirellulales bacterium]
MLFEFLESRRLLASDWQNQALNRDVDQSGQVTPVDALIVIDRLNRSQAHDLGNLVANQPLVDVNGDGQCSALDALLVIDALDKLKNQSPQFVGSLSPQSDPNDNGVVLVPNITLQGQTTSGSMISLKLDNQIVDLPRIQADDSGNFQFAVTLHDGKNALSISATDPLGRQIISSMEVRVGNVVEDWNAAALQVVRQWNTLSNDPFINRVVTSQPPLVARNLAMIHEAIYNAVVAVDPRYPRYHSTESASPGTDMEVAAAEAAQVVASKLYAEPDELAVWQASFNETWQHSQASAEGKSLGIELGKRIGQAVLQSRVNDGAKSKSNYQPTDQLGKWDRTFPDYLPPLLPQWPGVNPFVMASGSQFRPDPPPALDSQEYAAAVDQVMQLGAYDSTARTQEQTNIALFWADGGGSYTPPGHWNQIAADVAMQHHQDLVDSAKTFALLNFAMADAGIAAWDAKYSYDFWRPIDAIRQADLDGNAATTANSTWMPLLKTPPFPTYTSGHSTFSGAASTVLAGIFGDNTSFDSQMDAHDGPEQRPLADSQVMTRHFTSFTQAAEEAGISRIYGGIHFAFDNTAGLALGRSIGNLVIANENTSPRSEVF